MLTLISSLEICSWPKQNHIVSSSLVEQRGMEL